MGVGATSPPIKENIMRTQMQYLISAYYTYATGAPLSLAAAAARTWAVGYVWAIPAFRQRFSKLEMELYAATL